MEISIDDITQHVKAGRSTTLEWLAEGASLDTIASVLTGMANNQGGLLLLGVVGPSPAIIGVKDQNNVADRVVQAALAIEPRLIIPYPQTVRFNDRPLVVAHIPRGMPHVYSYDGRFLVRQDTENKALAPRDLRRMFIERGDLSYETEVAARASLDDLDWEKATAYARRLGVGSEGSIENTLLRRGCLNEQSGRMRPTHAGLLLFGKDPGRFVRSAEITAARFMDDTMTDQFIKQDIFGTIPDQLERVEAFLRDHLRKGVSLGYNMARSEQYEVPLEAARELVVNAVAHRDYSIEGDCIHLNLYRNRMEVISPGGLPGPITLDNMKDERFSRNPAIVQVLSDMHYIERLGYGVNRVFSLMHERNLRAPQFEDTPSTFKAVLFNQYEPTLIEIQPEIPSLSEFHGMYKGQAINPRQESALVFLHTGNTRITNKDLQAQYPDVHAETIRRDLADLVNRNVLRKLGEKRGSYYVLKPE